jgi:ssDNA-binding Zn-finger/Zn-ribbon topoisomerase 1
MTQQQSQSEDAPRRCPRCGGRMIKHTGSAFYWHADYNHPACEITNIADPPKLIDASAPAAPSPDAGSSVPKQRKK